MLLILCFSESINLLFLRNDKIIVLFSSLHSTTWLEVIILYFLVFIIALKCIYAI